MKNNRLYVDVHILQTVPPSCINRDATGSPKIAVYGGVKRARISSQSWKNAIRKMFSEELYLPTDLGTRTKRLAEKIAEQVRVQAPDLQKSNIEILESVRNVVNLAAKNPIIPDISYDGIKKTLNKAAKEWKDTGEDYEENHLVDEVKELFVDKEITEVDLSSANTIKDIFKTLDPFFTKNAADDKKRMQSIILETLLLSQTVRELSGTETDALFFIGNNETEAIASLVVYVLQNNVDTTEKNAKKELEKQVQEALNVREDKVYAVDVAMFGRMVAKNPKINADASVQVAHAISTHKVVNEFDYFTAVDDFPSDEKEDAGASMIGDVEYNSSTLYRYATVAVHDLFRQLGSKEATTKAVVSFVDAFVRSMPKGKQNTFANWTPPDAVLVTIRTNQPINLVGAFERPIEKSEKGYREASAVEFIKHAKETYKNWLGEPDVSLVTGEFFAELGVQKSLQDLLTALAGEVRDRIIIEE